MREEKEKKKKEEVIIYKKSDTKYPEKLVQRTF